MLLLLASCEFLVLQLASNSMVVGLNYNTHVTRDEVPMSRLLSTLYATTFTDSAVDVLVIFTTFYEYIDYEVRVGWGRATTFSNVRVVVGIVRMAFHTEVSSATVPYKRSLF